MSMPKSKNGAVRARALSVALAAALLASCGGDGTSVAPTETLAARPWLETLEVDGEIRAAANTPLIVPGSNWESRALIEMVADGSLVRKGQVLARFDAPRARMELSQAETELLRKALGEAGIAAGAAVSRAELSADSAKVESDLGLSKRYAGSDLSFLARNKILDALQDVGFLNTKHDYLGWKSGQVGARSAAERAVMLSQKDSIALNAQQKRKSLDALELLAPHDGVFLLKPKWDGSTPQVGGNMWASEEFGSLPDMGHLIAHFSVAEGQAFGLKPGLPVRARLAGTGTEIELKVTKVGSSASPKSRESPVKYSDFDAAIDPATALRLGLKPGQALQATVRLIDQPWALTVPNLALVQDGARYSLFTGAGPNGVKQAVELGLRGPVRSQIKSGLAAGARIFLLPPTTGAKP
ncbi:MAG: secretion protein HlyD [Pseudomonadota bacterium]